jgi:hypothetical protein
MSLAAAADWETVRMAGIRTRRRKRRESILDLRGLRKNDSSFFSLLYVSI